MHVSTVALNESIADDLVKASSKMAKSTFKMADLLRFFTFYDTNFTLWER